MHIINICTYYNICVYTHISEVCPNVITCYNSSSRGQSNVPCQYAECSCFSSTYKGTSNNYQLKKSVLTIDSKQAKAFSTRYGQTDTIYSLLSWLDPTTTQMRRVDLQASSFIQ